jgi:hypothetical protein
MNFVYSVSINPERKEVSKMLDKNIALASETGSYLDTARYLNDVELATTLLENGKQNMIRIPFP